MPDTSLSAQNIADLTAYAGDATSTVPNSQLGKDEFLQMLVAQLRYQDPLEPMKDQEFISQLAQFSSLEQMSNMNENLTENLNWNYLLSQTINNTMATSLLGREVKANGSDVYISSDSSAKMHYKLGAFAETVTIDVFDGSGKKVASHTVDKVGEGDQVFEWDGTMLSGDRAQAGTYSYTVTAVDSAGKEIVAAPYMKGIVTGVHYIEGQAYLIMDGARISLGDVIEVGTGEENG
ncbi:MAG: flagellar hook assembly protein FlgD [candidate division Zixibacteria bacterium]|nr:flagellar hook assembly protein FlgD [candidate division Zixibacteria bacterium]MBU1471565.1 flagellar hook assembly protein FlgD [candidate division Zixibacteria bacterium]MBU2626340.1 flagellar hook assembly protein FlgD [candidate division Zixibacteria bacterium]